MILGDSFTFGLGVKQELAYPEFWKKNLESDLSEMILQC